MSEQKTEKEGVGYSRDASWWRNPNTTAPKRVHRDKGEGFAVCSRLIMLIMLDTDTPIVLAGTPATALCQRCFPSSLPLGRQEGE